MNSIPILRSLSLLGWALVIGFALYLFFDDYNRIPFQTGRTESRYLPRVSGSPLAVMEQSQLATLSADNAVMPIFGGADALATRLRLIEEAKSSIDLQYFLIKPDFAGAVMAQALYDAAERGVRVRFLLDDVFTTARDDQVRYLASHPNIEIRYFNPLSRRVWRWVNYVLDPISSNRRMHNKSMTVDGAFGVVGGRNIADEYYAIDRSHNFADYDMLIAGVAVDQVGIEFDRYWADEFSVDMQFFLGPLSPEARKSAGRENFALARQARQAVYRDMQENRFIADLLSGVTGMIPVTATRIVADQPAKLRVSTRQATLFPVANEITEAFADAKEEVVLLTPYFVPQKWGTQLFQDLAERGVKVRIITNSLASTNHAYVHGGYFPRRKALLRSGVALNEVRADAPSIVAGAAAPQLTMHTKLAMVDRKKIIVTSLNFDPRSIIQNTELALFADSSELAQALFAQYEPALADYTYSLKLDEKGALAWHYNGVNQATISAREPASLGRKLVAWLSWVLPVETQL